MNQRMQHKFGLMLLATEEFATVGFIKAIYDELIALQYGCTLKERHTNGNIYNPLSNPLGSSSLLKK